MRLYREIRNYTRISNIKLLKEFRSLHQAVQSILSFLAYAAVMIVVYPCTSNVTLSGSLLWTEDDVYLKREGWVVYSRNNSTALILPLLFSRSFNFIRIKTTAVLPHSKAPSICRRKRPPLYRFHTTHH
jgi:hypothetical protein